jgi:peptide/nickel transport system substrate-binding protein
MRLLPATRHRTARLVQTIALIAISGCARDAGRGGTIIIGTSSDPETLFPPLAKQLQARTVTDLLFEKLADLGPALNTVGDAGFEPRLAQRWEWSRDSLAVTFHIDPRARWHNGRPVRAEDVRFAFAVYTDTLVGARSAGELRGALDSVSVADSLTCTAWFRQRTPEQFYTVVSTVVPLPEHLLGKIRKDSLGSSAFARAPVGNGPFKFVRWEPAQRVEIAAVDNFFRGRPGLDRVIWTISPQASTLVQQLKAGEADFLEMLSPADAAGSAKLPGVRIIRRGNFDYNFLTFNLYDGPSARPHPLFADRALRRALTMALDRAALRRSVFDSLGAVGLGPFVRLQWSADTSVRQLPFDRTAAERALDSLGWRRGADGTRARDGRSLAFTLLVPSSSLFRQNYAVLIQEQFRQVGVKVNVEKPDYPAFANSLKERRFDAAIDNRGTTPSPSGIRQSWTSTAAANGGFNTGRYQSSAFDAQVDSALASSNVKTARVHYRAAYQIIIDDAAAIWLYEPPQLSGAQARLMTGPLRADAWWETVPAWKVATGSRVSRDAAVAKSP